MDNIERAKNLLRSHILLKQLPNYLQKLVRVRMLHYYLF